MDILKISLAFDVIFQPYTQSDHYDTPYLQVLCWKADQKNNALRSNRYLPTLLRLKPVGLAIC